MYKNFKNEEIKEFNKVLEILINNDHFMINIKNLFINDFHNLEKNEEKNNKVEKNEEKNKKEEKNKEFEKEIKMKEILIKKYFEKKEKIKINKYEEIEKETFSKMIKNLKNKNMILYFMKNQKIQDYSKYLIKIINLNDQEIFEEIKEIEKYNLSTIKDKNENNILHISCKFGNLELIKKIINIDSNLLIQNNIHGMKPFNISLVYSHKNVSDYLNSINALKSNVNVFDISSDVFEYILTFFSFDDKSFINFKYSCSRFYEITGFFFFFFLI
jgi:hypothetical protein